MATSRQGVIDELLLFEAKDETSAKEASTYTKTHNDPLWKVASIGVRGIKGIQLAINNVVHIRQLTLCRRCVDEDFSGLVLPRELFGDTRRLMFMDHCQQTPESEDVSRDRSLEKKVLNNGRRFFNGEAGVIGISSACYFEHPCRPLIRRRHTFFYLDEQGRVQIRKVVTPLMPLKCG